MAIVTRVQKAFKYIQEQMAIFPDQDRHKLVDEAGMRFSLSPAESQALERIVQEKK